MKPLRVLLRRLAGVLQRGHRDAEFEEELRSHLEMHIADNVRAGMTPEQARRDALIKLGGVAAVQESHRDQSGLPFLETAAKDIVYAIRVLGRSRLFTTMAVLTLAFGIGANTAIFSLVDQLLVRTLPVPEPHRLVFLQWKGMFIGGTIRGGSTTFSYPTYTDLHDSQPGVFTGIAGRRQEWIDFDDGGPAQRAVAELVSGNYFQVLQAGAAIGRVFVPGDDGVKDASPYVVLGYAFWKRQFGGRNEILGRTIHINGHPMTVIGVAQRGFGGVQAIAPADVFVPISMKPAVTPTWDDRQRRDSFWLNVFARLRPGVSMESARTAMQGPFRQTLERDLDAVKGQRSKEFARRYVQTTLALADARRGFVQESLAQPLFVLFSMVGMLLLIACVNIANLLIARAGARRREIAIRLSLGSSKAGLMRLLACEALVIGAVAGLAGLLVSVWFMHVLVSLAPWPELASAIETMPDWHVALFAAGLSLLASVLLGLAPGAHAVRMDANAALKDGAASLSAGRGRTRFRKMLVCAQVALSLTLLSAAGLFSRSLTKVMNTDPGFAADRLLAFTIDPSLHGYTAQRALWLFTEVQDKLREIPGVMSAAGAASRLLRGGSWINTIHVEGYRPSPDENMDAGWNQVMPGFFSTIGVAVIAGREFTGRDAAGAPRVVLVNQAFAKRFCGGGSCVGGRLGFGSGRSLDVQIVGVVQDMKHDSLTERAKPWVFGPALQDKQPSEMTFYLRTRQKPEALETAARKAVGAIDRSLPVFVVKTVRADINEAHFAYRFFAFLSTAFAVLATLLSAIGLYGVTSYAVARRTQEFGVRMAMGAGHAEITRLVIGEVGALTLVGVAAGCAVSLALGRFLASLLYQMKPHDPVVFIAGSLLITATALVAALGPVIRAVRVHPMQALRHE